MFKIALGFWEGSLSTGKGMLRTKLSEGKLREIEGNTNLMSVFQRALGQ